MDVINRETCQPEIVLARKWNKKTQRKEFALCLQVSMNLLNPVSWFGVDRPSNDRIEAARNEYFEKTKLGSLIEGCGYFSIPQF